MPQPAAVLSPIDETSFLLKEWARWSRLGNGLGQLRYPSQATFQRLRGSSVRTPLISDEMASRADLAVSRLVDLDPEGGGILLAYFLEGQAIAWIARDLELQRARVDKILAASIAWIAGKLDPDQY